MKLYFDSIFRSLRRPVMGPHEQQNQELNTIERQPPQLRGMAWLLVAGMVAGVLVGQGAPRHVGKAVEAEQYVLRDSGGKMRGELSTRTDDAPKLWLYDEAGARRLELSLLSDGTPGLRLLDRKEQIRATFGILDGEPSLTLRDHNGQDRAKLILLTNGEPSFFLRDKNGHAVWSSPSIHPMQ